jgi:hypothetical protein
LRNRCNEIDEEHFKLIAELDKQFWSYKNDLKDYRIDNTSNKIIDSLEKW